MRWERAPLAGGLPHVRQVVEVRLGSGPDARVVRTCTVTGALSRCAMPKPPQRGELTVRIRTDNLFGQGEWSPPVRVR